MPELISEVTLVLRRWDKEIGLSEHLQVYPTLNSLYTACLTLPKADLIDRLIIRGRDETGKERVLTFAFQSETMDSA